VDIPIRDTPALELIERGFGGRRTDKQDVADCMQLLRVAKVLLGFFYLRFASEGISPGKYSVLCELLALADGSTLSPSMLAKRIGVSRPAITGLIDGLCKQGYVIRRTDGLDRRRITVELTSAGRAFIEDLLPEQFRTMSSVIGVLSAEERGHLRELLTNLEGHLSCHELTSS
jgi:DNA-binding MarR family transcriptional regulator